MIATGVLRGVLLVFTIGILVLTSSCRTTYYKAWETFGVYKRDLLKENVEEARDEQQKAAEQFKDALTRLKELTGFQGGDLEALYDRLEREYKRSESRAEAVRERIQKVENVAADLFKEWDKEIETMENAKLAADSRSKLRVTRDKYEELHTAMERAEKSMGPVLTQLKDHVLYLKHNLNAQAIGALKGETFDVEKEIQELIREMNAAIAEADAFIRGLQ